jgi:hypothetical protein
MGALRDVLKSGNGGFSLASFHGGKGGIRVSRDSVLTYLKQYSFPEKYSLDIP